jgi:HTH-type transcriptional regulator, transcriptional repressor of NAD biosynthesis genes
MIVSHGVKSASDPLRICVLGAESTGKTTLCADLAAHYGVPFVHEFGRWYTEAMPDPSRYTWSHEDFVTIARTQNRFEDDAARWVRPVLICDTNSFVTDVFEQAYLGESAAGLGDLWRDRTYDLLVITDPQTPFEQDTTTGLRSADARAWMHRRYEEYAAQSESEWLLVSGNRDARVETVVAHVAALQG